MALTAVEEAQLRDLIAQQSALLSLAGVEATILSKLGATKVTLSDLPSSTAINDADLLLLRQGTTDKSVTGLTFKNLIPTVADASTTVKGIVELATDAETQTGTDTVRAITPSNLSARTATETRTGVVELATDAEAKTGTDTTLAITPANLKAAGLGLGQTWQNFTGSRAFATTYTNTTGKPIQLMIVAYAAAGDEASITLNGSLTAKVVFGVGTAGQFIGSCYAIIPNGNTYALTITAGSPTIQDWFELRT